MGKSQESSFQKFDNFEVNNLSYLLNEDTTLKRYYPLISYKKEIIDHLVSADINDKYAYLSLTDEELHQKTSLCIEKIQLLRMLFHLHDFKDRKLKEIECIDKNFMQMLIDEKIKTSSKYIGLCCSGDVGSVAKKYNTDSNEVYKLLCLCDLMRLPGVKNVRAELYFNCGFETIQSFVGKDAEKIREEITNVISRNNLSQGVPLLKEINTQIAVATILPKLL